MSATEPFWRTKSLDAMSDAEWESLCDGCGQCCRMKLEDVENGEVVHTQIACRLLDIHACRCTDYENRHHLVPACLRLDPSNIGDLGWLPETCGYRRVARGQDLESWHPLISGDRESVHRAGISVRGKLVPEAAIDDLDGFLAETYGLEVL
ncbi:MAG: YcgN family cysteine cluster protein [Acidobacteriota bacterium]